jgi:hypothetical protein
VPTLPRHNQHGEAVPVLWTIAARTQHPIYRTSDGWLASWWVWSLILIVLLCGAIWILVHDDLA